MITLNHIKTKADQGYTVSVSSDELHDLYPSAIEHSPLSNRKSFNVQIAVYHLKRWCNREGLRLTVDHYRGAFLVESC